MYRLFDILGTNMHAHNSCLNYSNAYNFTNMPKPKQLLFKTLEDQWKKPSIIDEDI